MSKCPRCGGGMTRFPALSRWDNDTDVCGPCGQQEAMAQFGAAQSGESREEINAVLDPVSGNVPWVIPPKAS